MKTFLHPSFTFFLNKRECETIGNKKTKLNAEVSTFCRTITDQIAALEKNHTRDQIITAIAPFRQLLRESSLLMRTQDWPRGYAGDFETIEAIIKKKNTSTLYSRAYYFEDYFIYSPIAQQHRNKIARQREAILSCINKNTKAKILSIGCGGSEDLYLSISEIQKSKVQFTLVDIDADALAYSCKKLQAIEDRITTHQGNIFKIIHQLSDSYDLILIGGVFDYVSDKFIKTILRKLFTFNLSASGTILFTNIAENNPFRIPLEYFFNWFLIERTKEQLLKLIQSIEISFQDLRIEKEETGLTYLVYLKK